MSELLKMLEKLVCKQFVQKAKGGLCVKYVSLKINLLFDSKRELLLIKIYNIKNYQNTADRKNIEDI